MSDDSQIVVPRSFIELFIPPHGHKPTRPREHIAARYEFCEDLAQMLSEDCRGRALQLGVQPSDVLERVARGLASPDSGLDAAEAGWVVTRIAELMS